MLGTQSPIVTIGLPVYNAGPYLASCLRSIFAQTRSDWELVAVDDGSSDESVSLLQGIRDSRVRVFCATERNQGLPACLNQITAHARGQFIVRMDADDMMHPLRVERQVQFLLDRPELDGAGCGLIILDRRLEPIGRRFVPAEHEAVCAHPLKGFHLAHATFVGRAGWFRAHPYREGNHGCEDWELWLSTFRTSRFANIPGPLYFYRELNSFTLRKYLHKKLNFAACLWREGQSQFGTARTLLECGRQFAHMCLYAGAGILGMTERLVLRRNLPLDNISLDHIREVIRQILATDLPVSSAASATALLRKENSFLSAEMAKPTGRRAASSPGQL